MERIISDYLNEIRFGEAQQYENMAVLPLFTDVAGDIEYMTLKDAMLRNLLKVEEIDKGGSVPELKVTNMAEIPVLLLDGEEVAGAKQNRVLNTSILLKEKSVTVIPVSCTEQGRWSYSTEMFYDSGHVMSPKARAVKSQSVSHSLKVNDSYSSNQGAVWDQISELSARANVRSDTGAMRDVFEMRGKDLSDYTDAFTIMPGQKGLMVFIDGKVEGLDMLSNEDACKSCHHKLIRSYAMEAIASEKKSGTEASMEMAKEFLRKAAACSEEKFPSKGLGVDYRFSGDGVIGSALLHEEQVIHMAFFRHLNYEGDGSISSLRRRRGYRI